MNVRSVALALSLAGSVVAACNQTPKPSETGATPSASAASAPTESASPPPAPTESAAPAPSAEPPAPSAEAPAPSAAPVASAKPGTQAAPVAIAPEDACQITKHFAAVKAACASGGRPAVKAIMKRVVKKAKAAGEDESCGSCHVDTKAFTLKSNALTDLKRWL